jgi:hypothetical protein
MLTRLGESGVDAFTIMRIAGHSSVVISQRYVHPTPEATERAFERSELHASGNVFDQWYRAVPDKIVGGSQPS